MRFLHLSAVELAPHVQGLRKLEASIQYPVGQSDAFVIDHGSRYHPFFSELGEAHFLLAIAGSTGSTVVGTVVGVLRKARLGNQDVSSLYICDLKTAESHRGGRLSGQLLRRGLFEILKTPSARRARLFYGAAMRRGQGDVMKSVTRANPLRLGGHIARAAVYFVPPSQLAAIEPDGCPKPPSTLGLDLSPGPCEPWISTRGRKDLNLVSTKRPWPLVHLVLGPDRWLPSWGHYLQSAGGTLSQPMEEPGVLACFAIDERLREHIDWLGTKGIHPQASFTIYGLSLAFHARVAWVHLATSEV